jgi:hypothetical protein
MKKGVMVFGVILAGMLNGMAQVGNVSQAQSMFIYNFSRLIQWPSGSAAGDFVIGVVGDNEIYNSLVSFVSNKKVGTQSIVVRKFEEPQTVSRCHIIFVGDSKISRLSDIIARLQGSNSLIITEKRGMIHSGAAIDFFVEQDKLKFVLNTENAEKYKLIVSKSLQDMAYKN